MEFNDQEERFLLFGESYNETEVLYARSIRIMSDSKEKTMCIAAFENRTKKTFPIDEPIEYGFNPHVCLDSRVIDRSVKHIMSHPREVRSCLPL